jgi:hypothetical protein
MPVLLLALMIMMSKYKLHVFNERANHYISVHSYISTVYLSFTHGIPSESEHLFNVPNQWPSFCGNANADKFEFSIIYLNYFDWF